MNKYYNLTNKNLLILWLPKDDLSMCNSIINNENQTTFDFSHQFCITNYQFWCHHNI